MRRERKKRMVGKRQMRREQERKVLKRRHKMNV